MSKPGNCLGVSMKFLGFLMLVEFFFCVCVWFMLKQLIFCFSRMGILFLYVLVLISWDRIYMSILCIWLSTSRMRVCISSSMYSCVACPTTQPFQDLNKPLGSLLLTGRPSSNLTMTWKPSCKYTLTQGNAAVRQCPQNIFSICSESHNGQIELNKKRCQ